MPSTSLKQHNLMEGVAHDPAFARRVGISQKVGRDFVDADRGKHFTRPKRQVGGLAPTDVGGWWQQQQIEPVKQHGLISGVTPGRADALNFKVPMGAYIVPADVVSALGEGNTLAGAQKLNEVLEDRGQSRAMFANGGRMQIGQLVPVRLSDGEYVIAPGYVAQMGQGDIDQGHDAFDELVKQARQDNIKTLKSLPGPVR